MNRILIFSLSLIILGCSGNDYTSNKISYLINSELEKNNYQFIDFSKFYGPDWSKVCFLGPYNERSDELLGFNWQVSDHTDVLKSDGHAVIIFASNVKVIGYIEHRRGRGGFEYLTGQCFIRENATLSRDPDTGEWKVITKQGNNTK